MSRDSRFSDYDNRIISLGSYHPVRSRQFDDYSRKILDFKEGKEEAVQFFRDKVLDFLNQNLEKGSRFKFCTVPRSQPKSEKQGFRELYNLLKQDRIYRDRIMNSNDANLLKRDTAIPKQTQLPRGERDILVHFNSISARNIRPRDQVVLFDDVITTGNSMRASCCILEQAGAQVLWAIGLAQTV